MKRTLNTTHLLQYRRTRSLHFWIMAVGSRSNIPWALCTDCLVWDRVNPPFSLECKYPEGNCWDSSFSSLCTAQVEQANWLQVDVEHQMVAHHHKSQYRCRGCHIRLYFSSVVWDEFKKCHFAIAICGQEDVCLQKAQCQVLNILFYWTITLPKQELNRVCGWWTDIFSFYVSSPAQTSFLKEDHLSLSLTSVLAKPCCHCTLNKSFC